MPSNDDRSGFTDFDRDFKWSKRFLGDSYTILGHLGWRVSTFIEDTRHGIDLVLDNSTRRVALRVRDPAHCSEDQFLADTAIRYSKATTDCTEWQKIASGQCQSEIMLYCLARPSPSDRLARYRVLDIPKLGEWLRAITPAGYTQKPNKNDGSETVARYVISKYLPKGTILHQGRFDPGQAFPLIRESIPEPRPIEDFSDAEVKCMLDQPKSPESPPTEAADKDLAKILQGV